jgi:hypothetical protein
MPEVAGKIKRRQGDGSAERHLDFIEFITEKMN